ncbi:cathelicidin-related peptide Oh-Cath-like [Crotalus adamanteus]|uniref:Cathelicidin-related antimicrobial peptide n=1 Tax=Crotalus adamanteus TaxID=8729 RepID=A0AAW1B1H4_CROAD
MEGCFGKALLLMGVLSACGTSSLPHQPLTYDEAVGLAVAVYNSKAGEDCVYRLLEARAEPRWDPVSESHPELNFTIKETWCLLEDAILFEECDFKDDGVIRQCLGYYVLEERPPVVVLSCVPVGGKQEKKGEEVEKREEEKKEEQEEEEEEEKEKKKEEEEKDQPRRAKRFLRVFKKLKKGMEKLFRKKKLVPGSVAS